MMRWFWTILAILLLLGCGPWTFALEVGPLRRLLRVYAGTAELRESAPPGHQPPLATLRFWPGKASFAFDYWDHTWLLAMDRRFSPPRYRAGLVLPGAGATLTAAWLWRRRSSPRPGHCWCGYALTGHTTGACPECGRAAVNRVSLGAPGTSRQSGPR